MGSAFAAVKAGIIGGILYAGAIGVFNVGIVTLSRDRILGTLSALPECAGVAGGGKVATPAECFTSILAVYLPYVLFLIFVVSLIFASIYGILFEFMPWQSYVVKALAISSLLFTAIFYLGFTGVPFDRPSQIAIASFDIAATIFYAVVLATFYKRYTRVVEFLSQDPEILRIFVGKSDVTGKRRTFATNSAHKVRAEPQRDIAFKEWSFSGGVSLEDARSWETVMRVAGEGMLRASSTRSP